MRYQILADGSRFWRNWASRKQAERMREVTTNAKKKLTDLGLKAIQDNQRQVVGSSK